FDTPPQALAGHLARMLAEPNSAIFLATNGDGAAVGFSAALVGVGLEFGVTAQIESLYVTPKTRGKRVGSRLIGAALAWCEAAGAREVFAAINAQGEPGRQLERLFMRLGFAQSRRRLMYRALDEDRPGS
ncbi:MAG: GNAT family N-acetyltransferase, partial [Alphaproteobacteria bacterium]